MHIQGADTAEIRVAAAHIQGANTAEIRVADAHTGGRYSRDNGSNCLQAAAKHPKGR
jgi:hypothetical protein